MSPDVARLLEGAPTRQQVVELLVDAFTGCGPDVLALAPAETETSAA